MSDFAVDGSEYGIMPVAQPDSSNGAVDKLAGGASKYCMIDTKFNSEAQQQAAKDFLNWLVYDEKGQDFLVNKCSLVPSFSNITLEVTNPMGLSVQSYANEGNLIPGYPEYPETTGKKWVLRCRNIWEARKQETSWLTILRHTGRHSNTFYIS